MNDKVLEKWNQTGLLRNLDENEKMSMALLLERTIQYLMADPERKAFAGVLLPIIRRVYGPSGLENEFPALDYRISSQKIDDYDVEITIPNLNEAIAAQQGFYGLDREVEFCVDVSCRARESILRLGPIEVGQVPLGVRRSTDGLWHFFAQVMPRNL